MRPFDSSEALGSTASTITNLERDFGSDRRAVCKQEIVEAGSADRDLEGLFRVPGEVNGCGARGTARIRTARSITTRKRGLTGSGAQSYQCFGSLTSILYTPSSSFASSAHCF